MALTKVINSESKQYKPVLVDKLVLDAVPTVNSLNGVTSDAVARAISGASGEVPQVTENDNGKVLTAIYDEGGPAVEWGEAASGLPDMAGNDGKILGAVDNDGTMEAQWINKPVSNVTTSDKQFVVGVNGTGLPITVDCANASETASTSTITENGSMVGSQFVYVHFDLAGLPVNNLGDATATLVVPEDVSVTENRFSLNANAVVAYWNSSTNSYATATGGSISGTIVDSAHLTIKAGTYTISGSNPAPAQFTDGLVIKIEGGGAPDDWNAFLAAVAEACTSWTLTYTSSEVTGYTIKPTVIATPGSDASGKVLTVTDTQGNYGWQPVPKELPSSTSADENKVLTVNSSGNAVWAPAQGGGGGGGASYTAGQGIAIDGNNAISVDASSSDFTFGQSSSLPKWTNNYNFVPGYYPDSSVICTKDSYINMASETGNVHLVCDNTGSVAGNYAVCNANYAFSNWQLTSDVKIELSKTASDWTFTGNTFTLDNGLWYITIAGTTGSTVTPNGETPVAISDFFGTALFNVITNPNQLSLKNAIPTVDQSYNASSTHAQSGTAVAQALASAGGGITWTKITNSKITATSTALTAANFSYSIPSGKTAVQVTLMLRLSNCSGSWSTVPKQLSVELKLNDGNSSSYYYVGSIMSADAWSSASHPTLWMVAGTVVVPGDWYTSIDGITLELPYSGGSLPASYDKELFVGIA